MLFNAAQMATQRHRHARHRPSITFGHQLRFSPEDKAGAVLSCAGCVHAAEPEVFCQLRYGIGSSSSLRTIPARRLAASPSRNAGWRRTYLPTSSPMSRTDLWDSGCQPKSSAPPYPDGTTTVSPGRIAFAGAMPVLLLSSPHHSNTRCEPIHSFSVHTGTAIASRIEGGATM